MSRFRIHRSFEEELAKKADEFSMQPSLATWQGVEKGISKNQSTQKFWKLGVLGLSLLAIFGIYLIQDSKQPVQTHVQEVDHVLNHSGPDNPIFQQKRNSNLDKTQVHAQPGNPASYEKSSGKKGEEKLFIENAGYDEISLRAIRPKSILFGINTSPDRVAYLKTEKKAPYRKSRDGWYIQVNYSPSYAYRNISARTDYALPLEESKKRLDKGISGFTTRVQARYHFTERLSLAFGIAYSRTGERIGMAPKKKSPVYDALAEEYGYKTSEMNAVGDLTYYTNEYRYFELPFTLYSKKPLSPRISLTSGVGLSLAYMINTNARCYDYRVDHYVNNPKFFREWTIGSHAQLLIEYSLNTRWSVAAGPEVTYALLSTYRNYYTLSQHQFSVGMNLGVQWKLFDINKSRLAF